MFSKVRIFILSVLIFISNISIAATYYSLADGDWTDAIWSTNPSDPPSSGTALPGSLPNGNITNNDVIIIRHTVTNSTGVQINNGGTITIANGGYFDVASVTMNNGSSLGVEAGGVLDAEIIDGKNATAITNNGTIITTDCNGIPEPCQSTPLPVELISFTTSPSESSVSLNWSTASELNNDYFTLEKSRNGKDFEFLAEVAGNGTSHIRVDYGFTDHDPFLGLSYYRLSQTDYDGTTEVFPAVNAIYNGKKNFEVYPNPITTESLKIRASGKQKNAPVTLKVFNLQGRQMLIKEFLTNEFGILDEEVPFTSHFEKGTYMLEVTSSEGRDFIKVQKE